MGLSLFKRNLVKYGKTITLQDRAIQAPDFQTYDFDEVFTDSYEVTAILSTERGNTLFDGVSTDRPITHKVCIEYIDGITAETWVLYGDRRLDILDVENCGEENKILILRCADMGTAEASKV
jgi:hypothetical protein